MEGEETVVDEEQKSSEAEEKKPEKVQSSTKKAAPEETKSRLAEYEESMLEKYPKVAGKWNSFKEVWYETFPNPERQMAKRMEQRKAMAKLARESDEKLAKMTPEEI